MILDAEVLFVLLLPSSGRSLVINVYFTTGGGEREESRFRLILYARRPTPKTTVAFRRDCVCCATAVAR